jgi:predicted amidohydrolase YtcJ
VKPTADLIVTGARPWSEGRRLPGCDAVAVAAGRIVAVARAADLEALTGPATRRLDARGGTLTPGCTDAHLHLVAWARAGGELALDGARRRDDVLMVVARALAERGGEETLIGRGWSSEDWEEPPHRQALDAVSHGCAVVLHSRDFHTLWVNSAALARAGVTQDSADPPGGRLERDARGELTGVVREQAARLFVGLAPAPEPARDLERVRAALRALHAEGITAVHDFEGAGEQRVLRAMADGPVRVRVRVLMHLAHAGLDHALALGLESGLGDDWFRIGAVKLFADGTLGSRTAALLQPYDGTGDSGMELLPASELRALVARAHAGRLAVAIHAIGDRAVRASLDAFEQAGGGGRLPGRIEHAQLVDPADLKRFAALGVAASVQPVHCTSDIELASRYWSGRLAHAYPWRELLAGGALLAFGSDAPVERPSVAAGLHAAVTRQRPDGTPLEGFVPAQRIDLDAALSAWTEAPARLAGTWPRLGRIAPGGLGDLVVWDRDLHATPPQRLHEARPAWTVLDGEVVFEAEARDPGIRLASRAAVVGATR